MTRTNPSLGRQRAALVAAALLVSANLCLFGPAEVVLSNPGEFDVTFVKMLPGLLVLLLLLSLSLSVTGFWLRSRVRDRATSILLTIGFLLWVQGSFLKWGYGVFDGTDIDWGSYSWQGWVDLAIWTVPLVVAWIFSSRLARHAGFVAAAFVLVQMVVLVIRLAVGPGPPAGARQGEGATHVPPEVCKLSSTRNVFHFIMDAFQTDVFQELVEEDGLSELLDGFVLYTGNMSTGNQTVLSVPALFSTRVYDGSVAESEYFQRAMQSSFHTVLYQNDYVVNLIPHVSMDAKQSTAYFTCPRTYAVAPLTRTLQAVTFAVDVSMFRQLPHFVKRFIFNGQNWRVSSLVTDPPSHVSFHQKAFFRDYVHRLEVGYDGPAYHFMHLMPPHGPYVTLSDGSYAGEALPNTRENYKAEARYIVRIFVEFLERLKDLGLYDNSMILLHGDHGAGIAPEDTEVAMQKLIRAVTALLVLKPFNAEGPLRETNSQTILTDIPTTVMEALELDHPYPGESILDLSPEKTRSRGVIMLKDRASSKPVLRRWVVTGNVTEPKSWKRLEPVTVTKGVRPYTWGAPVRFGIAHSGDVYLTSGWSTTAPNYAWNDGTSATVTLGIDPPPSDIVVLIEFFAYISPGKVDRQRVRIWVNDFSIGEKVITDAGGQGLRARVPREAVRGDQLVVRFELPDAVAPRDIGAGRDGRELAIGLYSFEAVPLSNAGGRR